MDCRKCINSVALNIMMSVLGNMKQVIRNYVVILHLKLFDLKPPCFCMDNKFKITLYFKSPINKHPV